MIGTVERRFAAAIHNRDPGFLEGILGCAQGDVFSYSSGNAESVAAIFTELSTLCSNLGQLGYEIKIPLQSASEEYDPTSRIVIFPGGEISGRQLYDFFEKGKSDVIGTKKQNNLRDVEYENVALENPRRDGSLDLVFEDITITVYIAGSESQIGREYVRKHFLAQELPRVAQLYNEKFDSVDLETGQCIGEDRMP